MAQAQAILSRTSSGNCIMPQRARLHVSPNSIGMNMKPIIVILFITPTMALQSLKRHFSPVDVANERFFTEGTVVRIIYGLYDIDGQPSELSSWDVPPEIAWQDNFQQDAND